MNEIKWLVTGCGRSGTVYMARFLTELGIPCGHEMIFNHEPWYKSEERWKNPQKRQLSHCSTHEVKTNCKKIPHWVDPANTIAESSYLMVPHLSEPLLQNIPLIHIMRNPLEVVASFALKLNYFSRKKPNHDNAFNRLRWEDKIYAFLPGLKDIESQLERACYYYLEWNRQIAEEAQRRPYLLVATESIEQNQKLFQFFNTSPKIPSIDKKINSFGNKPALTLNMIPQGKIKDSFEIIIAEHNQLIVNTL